MIKIQAKYWTRAVIMIVFCISTSASFAQKIENSQLAKYIDLALKNNPGLEAAEQRIRVAEKFVPQAGALPDPQLTFSLMNLPVNSFAFNQEPMTGKLFSVMQMFPFPGKLGLKTDMAEFEANIARYKKDEVRNQIVTMVKKGYYNLYAIDRAIEIVEINRSLMRQFVNIAETKYATGSGLQHDVLRAQVELSKLEDDLIMWRQKRESAKAFLNALLNQAPDTPVPVTPKDVATQNVVNMEKVHITLETSRPLLKSWSEMVHKGEAALQLAKKDYWPNFAVGAGYRQRDDLKNGAVMHDFFSATVSVNVPLYFWRKQKPKVQEKESALAGLNADYTNVVNQVKAERASILAEIERNKKRADLFKGGILIQARQSLESALSGYQVNKVDFLTLINNWTMLQNYELQYYRALADYHKSAAEHERVTGIINL